MNKKITFIAVFTLFMSVFLWVQSGTAYMIEDETLVKAYKNGSEYSGTGPISGKSYSTWVDVIGDEDLYDTYGIDIAIDEKDLHFDIYTNFPESGDPASKSFFTGDNWLIPADLFFSIDEYEYGVALTDHLFKATWFTYDYVTKGSLYSYPSSQTSCEVFAGHPNWVYGGRYDEISPKKVPVLITDVGAPLGQGTVEWTQLVGAESNFRIDVDIPLFDLSGATFFDPNLDISQINVLFGTAICGNDVITGSSQPVPEPATLLLLGTGLLGLVGMGRKKFKRKLTVHG